jgi:hypothetical protein
MVYNTELLGFWSLSIIGILKTRKQRFRNLICFNPQVRWETPTQLGPLERANLNHWTY